MDKPIKLKRMNDTVLMPIAAFTVPERTERINDVLDEHGEVIVTVDGVPTWRLSNHVTEHVMNG